MSGVFIVYPNNHDLFILDTDASKTAIGATLSQTQWNDAVQEKLERPVTYASHTLTKTQWRYYFTRRELLAVIAFVWYFHQYRLGWKFLVRTDNSALRWIMSLKEAEDELAR